MTQPGTIVVFEARKRTEHPGPRARLVRPDAHGDYYNYVVDKYWIVADRQGDKLLCLTRGGKAHLVGTDELRKPKWWEFIKERSRFENLRAKLVDWQSGACRPKPERHPAQF